MAATASEAGLLEAVEVHQDQTACLVSLGISVDKARLGCVVQRLLATGQHVCVIDRSFQCLLDRNAGLEAGRETRPPPQF